VEQVLALAWFILIAMAKLRGVSHAARFLTQSVESHEKKRVEFLSGAKKVQKSAEECEYKGDSSERRAQVGRFEG